MDRSASYKDTADCFSGTHCLNNLVPKYEDQAIVRLCVLRCRGSDAAYMFLHILILYCEASILLEKCRTHWGKVFLDGLSSDLTRLWGTSQCSQNNQVSPRN